MWHLNTLPRVADVPPWPVFCFCINEFTVFIWIYISWFCTYFCTCCSCGGFPAKLFKQSTDLFGAQSTTWKPSSSPLSLQPVVKKASRWQCADGRGRREQQVFEESYRWFLKVSTVTISCKTKQDCGLFRLLTQFWSEAKKHKSFHRKKKRTYKLLYLFTGIVTRVDRLYETTQI